MASRIRASAWHIPCQHDSLTSIDVTKEVFFFQGGITVFTQEHVVAVNYLKQEIEGILQMIQKGSNGGFTINGTISVLPQRNSDSKT